MADRVQPVDPLLEFLLYIEDIEVVHRRAYQNMVSFFNVTRTPSMTSGFTQDNSGSNPTGSSGEVDVSVNRTTNVSHAIGDLFNIESRSEDLYEDEFSEYGVIKDEVFDRVEGFVQYPLSTEETSDDIQNPCGMCYSKSTETVFKECGHFYGCESCCKQLDNPECPVCRKPSGFIKLIPV